MKKLGVWVATAAFIAAVFYFDYAADLPEWTQIPEVWECPQLGGGFKWCP